MPCQDLTQPTHPKPSLRKSLPPPETRHPALSLCHATQYHWVSWPERPLVRSSSSVPPASLQKSHFLQNLGIHYCWQNVPNLGPGTLPVLTTFCCQLGALIKYAAETITSYCFKWLQKTSVVTTLLLRSPSSSTEVCLKAGSASSTSEGSVWHLSVGACWSGGGGEGEMQDLHRNGRHSTALASGEIMDKMYLRSKSEWCSTLL